VHWRVVVTSCFRTLSSRLEVCNICKQIEHNSRVTDRSSIFFGWGGGEVLGVRPVARGVQMDRMHPLQI
jgi:hypothetical protein